MFLAFQLIFSLGGIGGLEKDRNLVSSVQTVVQVVGAALTFLLFFAGGSSPSTLSSWILLAGFFSASSLGGYQYFSPHISS